MQLKTKIEDQPHPLDILTTPSTPSKEFENNCASIALGSLGDSVSQSKLIWFF
jgi:hypothetical protein